MQSKQVSSMLPSKYWARVKMADREESLRLLTTIAGFVQPAQGVKLPAPT
jgi:hypothetical protein